MKLKMTWNTDSETLLGLYRLTHLVVMIGLVCFVIFDYHWVWFLLVLLGGGPREILWHIYAKATYNDIIKMRNSAEEREQTLVKIVKEVKFGQKLASYMKNNEHHARDN